MVRLTLFAALAFLAFAPLAAAQDITGMARVTDSDKIEIDGVRIILHGADAMDRNQRCTMGGKVWDCWGNAVRFLQAMLDPEPTTCRKVGDAKFRRIYAVCHVGETNVNEALVRAGLALAYIKESDAWVTAERAAERDKAGFWNGEVIAPWEHRLSRAAFGAR